MEYLGDVYCGKKEDCVVFEKYRDGKGVEYAAFVSICSGCGSVDKEDNLCRYVVRRLQEWVRSHMQCREKVNFEWLSTGLKKEIRSIWKELEEKKKEAEGWTGGISIGNQCVVFALGKGHIYRINKLFGRGHCRLLCKGDIEKEQLKVLELEPMVGLLFLQENACLHLSMETLASCLGNGEAESEEWVSKRVRELGQFARESMGYMFRREV